MVPVLQFGCGCVIYCDTCATGWVWCAVIDSDTCATGWVWCAVIDSDTCTAGWVSSAAHADAVRLDDELHVDVPGGFPPVSAYGARFRRAQVSAGILHWGIQ